MVTLYGGKLPLADVSFIDSFLSTFQDSSGFMPNAFDIGRTLSTNEIPLMRLYRSNRPGTVEISNYVLFSPLDLRSEPSFNHGGGVTVTVKTPGAVREIKIYCKIFHYLSLINQNEVKINFMHQQQTATSNCGLASLAMPESKQSNQRPKTDEEVH